MKSLALVTYAKKAQVQIILDNHKNAIEAYAFIEHNKEKGEIHNHIFIKFNTDRKGTDILKWFENATDYKDERANTRFETVKSNIGILNYLTHKNQPDKFQYDESEIVFSDENAREKLLEEIERDNGYNALDDLLKGTPIRDIARKYGRDFIRYYNSYKMIATDIKVQEREIEQRKKEETFGLNNLTFSHNGQTELIIQNDTGEIISNG